MQTQRRGHQKYRKRPLGGASAVAWRLRHCFPRRLARARGKARAGVERHCGAAPPVRPRGRADSVAADVRVVHQWRVLQGR